MPNRGYGDELQAIGDGLRDIIRAAAADRTIPSDELRKVLRFISDVIEVVDQAVGGVYEVFLELKYLKPSDLDSERKVDLQKQLDKLVTGKHYREAEQICGRLRFLGEEYREQIEPIIGHVPRKCSWQGMVLLLYEEESRIIDIMDDAVRYFKALLDEATDANSIPPIRKAAEDEIQSLRTALSELNTLQNRILGISGEQGFLELTETDRGKLERQVTETTV